MTTPDTRVSEIKGFNRLQEEQGGIVPSKLKAGQGFLIETTKFVYGFKVDDSERDRRFQLQTGSPIARGHQVVVHICSHEPRLKYEMADWVGKGMRLILKLQTGISIMTLAVQGASVIGVRADGSEYTCDVWGKD